MTHRRLKLGYMPEGITTRLRNTTAYIQNWISLLEDDNRLIVYAAANAQKAVDSILGTSLEIEGEREEAVISGFPAIEANSFTQSLAA